MTAKKKTTATEPAAAVLPLDVQARLQAIEAQNAALAERLAAAERERDAAIAAAAAVPATGKRTPGFHPLNDLTERDTKAGIVGRACCILPNGLRFDYQAKRAANGRVYVREDFERRFVSDGKGGKRPTSGTDTDPATFAYLTRWRIENPEVLAAAADWAAAFAAEPTATN